MDNGYQRGEGNGRDEHCCDAVLGTLCIFTIHVQFGNMFKIMLLVSFIAMHIVQKDILTSYLSHAYLG